MSPRKIKPGFCERKKKYISAIYSGSHVCLVCVIVDEKLSRCLSSSMALLFIPVQVPRAAILPFLRHTDHLLRDKENLLRRDEYLHHRQGYLLFRHKPHQ